jgi:hypothetical protein
LDLEQEGREVVDVPLDIRRVVPAVQRCDAHLHRDAHQVVRYVFLFARRPLQDIEQLCDSVLERGLAQEAA